MALASGSRLGRIRIDDLLGIGGMGEVYRGWDEKLERAVALKVVHADKRLSSAMHSRFLREARVLSKLDHPNICRIYDVLEREEGDYLVLELVEGATLRERMREPLPRGTALDIALHVARVLAVTHARGIVHRDLKPDNIMVTPDGQVKVLDFGLARPLVDVGKDPEHAHDHAATAEDFTADDLEKTAVLGRAGSSTVRDDTHTSVGSLVGTLHYMSPEQARGLPLSEATDVYSLGVVLYEMLGGNRAYGEAASLNDLLVRVRRAEVQPFDFRDRALNALVKRMLALYPSDRPRAEDVVRAIEAIVARPARVRRRVFATLGASAIVLTVVGAFFVSRHLASTTRLFASKNARGRLAILPFRNATGDASLRWTEEGLEALVTEGVSRVRGADVVAAEDVVRTVRNLKIDPARELTAEQRRALLGALGVDVAILPTVVADGGKYTIRYAALRADRAETPREATSTVLVEAARAMSVQLAQRIDPSTTADVVSARYSLDATANMLFAMGMQEARVKGSRVAAHYFTVCVDRDPEFLLAKLYLASAHQQVAEHAQANELLADVMARAKQRNDRALIARGLVMRAAWAVDAGDYAAATRDATEALALARSLGDDDLTATALTRLGTAAWRSGQLDRARAIDLEALQIFTRLGNTHRQAELNNNLGIIADSAQKPDEGTSRYVAALAIAERINDRWIIATVTGNLGTSYGNTGDFARAETMTRRQLAMGRELGDKDTEITALVNLGLWLWAQGKEAEAVQFTEQAADAVGRAGNPRIETVLHANLAFAYAKLGNAAASRKHGEIARTKMQSFDDPEVDRDVQLGLAYALIRAGRLGDAERTLDRAERWQRSDRTEMMRARLAYAHGDYARAFERITKSKSMGGPWLIQNEQMRRAFEESARTGKPSSLAFESPWHERG